MTQNNEFDAQPNTGGNEDLNKTQALPRFTAPAGGQSVPPAPPAPPVPPTPQAAQYPAAAHSTANWSDQSAMHSAGHTQSGVAVETPVKKQRVLGPVVATAAITAILASAGTAALTGQFSADQSNSPTTQTAPTLGGAGEGAVNVPVASSTNENPDWQKVSAAVAPSVVAISVNMQQGSAQGSGVIIDAKGHIITNNHVVEGASNNTVQVTLNDGRIYDAKITGLDAATDLAVIQIENPPSDLRSAVFAQSDSVTVGSSVMAMGNPLGLSQTATTGIVSAVNRPVTTAQTSDGTLVVTNAIQIDAAINPGNSGGPLFNAQGEVIGITSSIATMSGSSSSQSGSIGLGFAIPSDLAKNIGAQLIDSGTAKHAFLGVTMQDGTGTADGSTRQGAVVASTSADSPAAKAGIQAKDVIVSVDGKSVTGTESLTGFVREHNAGDTVELGVIRDGKLITVKVTLAERTETATTTPDSGSGNGDSNQGGSGQGGSGHGGSSDQTNPNNLPNLGDLFPGLPGGNG